MYGAASCILPRGRRRGPSPDAALPSSDPAEGRHVNSVYAMVVRWPLMGVRWLRVVYRAMALVVAVATLLLFVSGCHHAEKAVPSAARVGRSETPPIAIDDAFRERAIGLDLDLLEDKTGALTFADVVSPEHAARFLPSTKASPNFGYTHSSWWARFSLEDRRNPADHAAGDALALTLAYAITDLAELWCADAAGAEVLHARAGDHVLLAEWPSAYREPTFLLPPGVSMCFLRVESEASVQLPLTLRTREAFAAHRLSDATLQSLYFGGLLVMIAYNGLVAVATRSGAYAFYTLFLMSYGLMQSALGGLGYALLWRDAVGWADRAVPLFIATTGLTSIPFAVLLLELPRTAPRFWLLARVTIAIEGLHLCVQGFFPYSVAIRAIIAIGVLWAFVMLASGVLQSSRGVRVAKLYLAAWTILTVGSLVVAAKNLGILPTNVFTVNAQQIGSAIEFVLLSFALADRIKTLQSEVATQANLAAANADLAREATQTALAVQESANVQLVRLAQEARDASDEAVSAREIAERELEERRRVQGELDAAAQQLTQAENMATLGMLMAGIAHDLRNPLNYVQGAAETLRSVLPILETGSEGERAKALTRASKVVGWVEKGTATMDAISLAMRNQARGGAAEIEHMNLREVVNEALLLCKSRTTFAELAVEAQDSTVFADPTGVGQVVMNLVSNAADALAEAKTRGHTGAPRILVRARFEAGRVVLEVHDSGEGIPEGLRAKILEPFFTTKPRGQGTGLGLAIVQRVTKAHGGSLEVGRSEPLGGAMFRLEFTGTR